MKIIYRIQDAEGRGPFKPGVTTKWLQWRPEVIPLIPWPMEFPWITMKHLRGYHFGCGCATVVQLQRWISDYEYRILQQLGYNAVKMQVSKIIAQSDIQTVFGRNIPLNVQVESFDLY